MKRRTSSRDTRGRGAATPAAGRLFEGPLFPDEPAPAAVNGGEPGADSGDRLQGSGEEPAAGSPATPDFEQVRRGGLGVALYAIDIGGPVTLEIHAQGEVYTFQADTAEEAFRLAFPPVPKDVFA